jgi:hypothetical protein
VIRSIVAVALACTLFTGCKKPAATTTASAAPSAEPAPAPAPVAATGIPTSEDFEQAANNEINPQNMETELEKLEKDIGH